MSDKKYIKATDWRTNKDFYRKLNSSHPLETKLDIYCPFDNTPLIRSDEESLRKDDTKRISYECPSCQTNYSEIRLESQTNVNDFSKKYLQEIKQKMNQLEKAKTSYLERCDCSELDKLKQWYNWVRDVNLVNLSEQNYSNKHTDHQKTGKIVNLQEYNEKKRNNDITKKILKESKNFSEGPNDHEED